MKPREFANHVKLQASATVTLAAKDAENRFRRRTPADRRKTRRAIYSEVHGTKARVGLRFAKQYPSQGTTTRKQFREQWKQIKPHVRQLIITELSAVLKGT